MVTYICGYRAYRDYDRLLHEPRGRASALVTGCMFSICLPTSELLSRNRKIKALINVIPPRLLEIVAIAAIFTTLYLVYNYYNQARRERLIKKFEEEYMVVRQLWGVISGITLILPIIIYALMLNQII